MTNTMLNEKWMKFYGLQAHRFIALIVRWYLAYVFISASIHKILVPSDFALDIASYQIMPLVLINMMAIVLPWVELVVGIFLILGFRSQSNALLVSGMMCMFMIALGIALYGGLNISCGCFASGTLEASDPISITTMFRDLAWLLLALYVLVFDNRAIGVDAFLMNRRTKTA
ncbi:MAG: MauE/DoxX family redox-associated membrane protein [Bradymonadales bacterium]|jgi:putative oxidoreductase